MNSATLSLRNRPWSSPSTHSVLGYADDGVVNASDFPASTVTPYGFGSPAGAQSLRSFTPTSAGDLFDVATFLGAERTRGTCYVAFRLSGSGGNQTHDWNAPTLTMNFTPVPEPATMIALGAGAFALLRRRARS